MQEKLLWGIDLGGTKIECAVLKDKAFEKSFEKGSDMELVVRERIATEASKGYAHIVQQIKKLVQSISDKIGAYPEKLGMATPGALDKHSQLLKNSNTTSLNGMPFRKDVEAALDVPVQISNDANCFALAELKMGVVPDVLENWENCEVAFGVIMGSGVGGGIVVNGKCITGIHGIAGEWGHNFLDESGGQCYCGKVGCVEKILSGKALEKYYKEISGQEKALKDIYRSHLNRDDKYSSDTMNRLIYFFGKGIASIINVLDPDVIIIGGGVGNIDLLYTEGIKEVQKHTFNDVLRTPIVKPKLGDSAGVFGAAFLVQ